MNNIEENLKKNHIILSKISAPIANYKPFIKLENKIYISGQLPVLNGNFEYKGKLGKEVSISDGKKAAEICVVNIVSILKAACNDDLSQVKKCLKLGIFINAIDNFSDHPEVANGASDLIIKIFGEEIGSHSRFAIGVSSLPKNVAIEIDAVFATK